MNAPNLNRFRLPTAHDERDAEAELEVELEKADRWQDDRRERELLEQEKYETKNQS